MTVLMISYDLKGKEPPEAYTTVKDMIEANSISWARPLYSQWFVETNDTVSEWQARMVEVTDDNDRWFISPVFGPWAGRLSTKVIDWLKERL